MARGHRPSTKSRAATAERQRQYRARQRAGLACFPLMVDEVAMIEALIANGWLRLADADDARKVKRAFARADMAMTILPRDASRRDDARIGTVEIDLVVDDDAKGAKP